MPKSKEPSLEDNLLLKKQQVWFQQQQIQFVQEVMTYRNERNIDVDRKDKKLEKSIQKILTYKPGKNLQKSNIDFYKQACVVCCRLIRNLKNYNEMDKKHFEKMIMQTAKIAEKDGKAKIIAEVTQTFDTPLQIGMQELLDTASRMLNTLASSSPSPSPSPSQDSSREHHAQGRSRPRSRRDTQHFIYGSGTRPQGDRYGLTPSYAVPVVQSQSEPSSTTPPESQHYIPSPYNADVGLRPKDAPDLTTTATLMGGVLVSQPKADGDNMEIVDDNSEKLGAVRSRANTLTSNSSSPQPGTTEEENVSDKEKSEKSNNSLRR